jgi:DNA polymerase-3 subunit alpha (Gram-positive type)
MREHKVPEWYIWSLSRIKYMFPKGHAVAYVTSALKIAWFKAHRPMDYYQAYFSIRAEGSMDAHIMYSNAVENLKAEIERIKNDKNATISETDRVTFLEVEIEMLERGIKFAAPDINKSHYSKFIPLDDNTLLMPLSSISGVGLAIAQSIYENRPYNSIEELKEKGKANKTFIEGYQQLNH